MNNVVISSHWGAKNQDATPIDGGGGPPYDVAMEARLVRLEEFAVDAKERLTKIESRLEQTPTKAELADKTGELKVEIHKSSNELIRWIVGTAIGLGAIAITVMTFVLNNATPKALPPPQTPPAIYYVQPAPTIQAAPLTTAPASAAASATTH